MRKKIAVLTTGRWDYGHLLYVMKEINMSSKLELIVLMPDNHSEREKLVSEFAGRVTCLLSIDNIDNYGYFYTSVRHILNHVEADLLVVLGDRFEAHAAATAALLSNIPIAHIHGGEVTRGAFDDELRDAITIMAKYHFVSHLEYGRKVASLVHRNHNMSNEITNCRIFNVGAPGLDFIAHTPVIHPIQLSETIDIDFNKPFVISVFNPVTKEQQYTRRHITNLINALYRYGEQVVFFMPNIDPSNEIIREQIYMASKKALNKWCVCESVPHEIFLSLMSYAEMMVGNSSSGIFEAPYYLLPVVNIGTRQEGRIKAYNVYDCGYEEEEIFKTMIGLTTMRKIFEIKKDHAELEMAFGKTGASKSIVKILEREFFPYKPVEVRGSDCGTEPHD